MTRAATEVSVEGRPWLTDPATQAVLAALEAAGGAGCARFVGGCVRNTLMGLAVDDLDLATPLHPDVVMAALKAAGLKVVPTGLAHGTVTAVSGGRPYEITTLRRDVSTDGRNATVAFTDDWAEDARRRDFHLNALYADREGRVFDPTERGVQDALAGEIVFVGDPAERIREDYLRILRFFRFFAWYGRGEPDPAGLAACTELADGMVRLSAERVSKELLKLLAAPDPRAAVRAMADSGILARVISAPQDLAAFDRMVLLSSDPALRLSSLLEPTAQAAMAAAKALRLSNSLRDRLVAAVGDRVDLDASPAEARAALYRAGRSAFVDRVLRAEATENRPGAGRGLLDLAETWPIPRLPVGGREIAALGVAPGPETGRILSTFEDSWIGADFPTSGHAERLSAIVRVLRD